MVEDLLDFYQQMLQIRLFEEKIDFLFTRNLIGGTTHLCIGQEATAVGAISEIQRKDYIVSTHRGHGHLLARGADPSRLMAELFGKETGYCKGKGGTQHLCMMDKNFIGTNGITGGGIPIATGVAFGIKLKKQDKIVLNFMGDGATNQGTFHESLNMASLWGLPIIYFCENNMYAMSTPINDSISVKDIADRVVAYDMKSYIVDGMDIFAIKAVMSEAYKFVKENHKPVFIEAKTYRFSGHSKSDKRVYRTKNEEAEWQNKDPIINFRNILINNKILNSSIEKIEHDVEQRIERCVEYAQQSPEPLETVAFQGVFADA